MIANDLYSTPSSKLKIDYLEPILYLAIHNGHYLSDSIAEKIGISEADRLREEDPYTSRFIVDKPNHVVQTVSRFQYDLNRSRDHAIYQSPDDCWSLPVYPRHPLTEQEITSSLQEYDAFYSKLINIIEDFLQRHEKIIVWDVHSYNHHRQGINAPYDSDEENPEIILGTNHYRYMPEHWKPIIDRIENDMNSRNFIGQFSNRALIHPHLDVRQNIKFSGGYLSQYLNHTYGDRVCCIAIEFKKIWMNEWTGEVDETCFKLLKKIFDSVSNISIN